MTNAVASVGFAGGTPTFAAPTKSFPSKVEFHRCRSPRHLLGRGLAPPPMIGTSAPCSPAPPRVPSLRHSLPQVDLRRLVAIDGSTHRESRAFRSPGGGVDTEILDDSPDEPVPSAREPRRRGPSLEEADSPVKLGGSLHDSRHVARRAHGWCPRARRQPMVKEGTSLQEDRYISSSREPVAFVDRGHSPGDPIESRSLTRRPSRDDSNGPDITTRPPSYAKRFASDREPIVLGSRSEVPRITVGCISSH